MIKLYYIEGISPNDQPTFQTVAQQQGYMSKHIVKTIESGFYPPLYRNEINLDIDDFDITAGKSTNYLSLTYGSKEYYYFIESIAYINERVYKLNIVMDVIQTYLFNVKINSARLTRKSIDRWKNTAGYINREYIRENINSGTMIDDGAGNYSSSGDYIHVILYSVNASDNCSQVQSGRLTDNNLTEVPYVIRLVYTEDDFINSAQVRNMTLTDVDLWGRSEDPTHYHPAYYYYDKLTDAINHVDKDTDEQLKNFKDIYQFVTSPTVYRVLRVPVEYFGATISFDTKNKVVQVIFGNKNLGLVWYTMGNLEQGEHGLIFNRNSHGLPFEETEDGNRITNYGCLPLLRDVKTLGFYQNKHIGREFNPYYCPQMIDSNYMSISYGDNQVQATIALEKLETQTYTLARKYDIITGDAMYGIFANDRTGSFITNENPYDSMVVSHIDYEIPLVTDAYKQYDSANKARLLGAVATLISPTLSGVTGLVDQPYKSTERVKVKSARGMPDKPFQAYAMDVTSTTKFPKPMSPMNLMEVAGAGISTALNTIEPGINAMLKPNEVKVSTGITSNMLTLSGQVWMYSYLTSTFDECAKYFETAGYAVVEYIENMTLVQDPTYNAYMRRYYFNVLQCEDACIDLVDFPEDQVTIHLISDRLRDGVRLWRTESNDDATEVSTYGHMGRPTEYDNVELKFL